MFLENTSDNNQPNIAEILSAERKCDFCDIKKDVIDLTPCPEGNGFYCDGCIESGEVVSYLKRVYKYKPEQITKFLNSIRA